MGQPVSVPELSDALCRHIHPHQNRGNLKNRSKEIAVQIQDVLVQRNAVGVRSQEEKQRLADSWLELAASFAKIPIKYEAEELKQQSKQEQPDRSPAKRVRSGEEEQRNEREMVFL